MGLLHRVIVIGGSAGCRDPLRTIIGSLPPGLPASVLVTTHLPPGGPNWLARALRDAGPLPVAEAADGEKLLPGRVYLAVPDRHMMVTADTVRLGRGPRENMARPALDPLFRSAAVAYGPRTVGVVLSGMLNDGAAGLDAIKTCGGRAVVQDPAEAGSPSMPVAALAATAVDNCLPAARIGPLLTVLSREAAAPAGPAPANIRLEVDIALGGSATREQFRDLADNSPLTCPTCSGVLGEVRGGGPLRFRCQTGHAVTADTLLDLQRATTGEALRLAMRILQERADLAHRMAQDAGARGRDALIGIFERRASEYQAQVDTVRRAILLDFESGESAESGAEEG